MAGCTATVLCRGLRWRARTFRALRPWGLAYAAQNGKKYTPAEFKALLLSSVYGIDDCFAGSKDGELGPIADMAVYKNKMGGGCIDALKLLFAVKGTPAVYVRTGEPVTVDLARYFGGDRSRVALTAASFVSPGNLGLSSSKAVFDGTKITFDCPEPGTSMLRISAVSGDTEFVREFAVVSRAGLGRQRRMALTGFPPRYVLRRFRAEPPFFCLY